LISGLEKDPKEMSQGASLTQQVEIFFKKAALQGELQKFLIHFPACFFYFS